MAELLDEPIPKGVENDSFRKRKIAWETLARRVFSGHPDQLSRVLTIIERVGSMQHERHKLLHGLIQWDANNPDQLNVYSHKNPHEVPWRLDSARIEAVARKIATLNADFLNVHNEYPTTPDLLNLDPDALPRRLGIRARAERPETSPEHERLLQSIREASTPPKRSSES